MLVQRFEDLVVWKESRQLARSIYKVFATNRDMGFCDQIQRAVVSIMNNIAEGFDRGKTSKDNKQLINFLSISHGSCGEVKSMLYLAQDLDYLTLAEAEHLRDDCLSVSKKLRNFINILQENNGRDNRIKTDYSNQLNVEPEAKPN